VYGCSPEAKGRSYRSAKPAKAASFLAPVEYPIPTANSGPEQITVGPDGNLWFVEASGNKIGEVTTAGSFNQYTVPTASSDPVSITNGPNSALWFTELNASKVTIGQVTTSGTITPYSDSIENAQPTDITTGTNGLLYFTDYADDTIESVNPSTGKFVSHNIPSADSGPTGITVGPDGLIWFIENSANKIASFDPSGNGGNGSFAEYSIPTANSDAETITTGPDGALWFTEMSGNKIGRLTTSGAFTEYKVPGANSGPQGITLGPDGALWFTESTSNQIGRIDTSGNFTEYTIPTANSDPQGIVAGLDNNIWFTEGAGNKIAKLVLHPDMTAKGTTIQATEGLPFTATLATFTDGNGDVDDVYTVTINWGDGSTSSGTVLNDSIIDHSLFDTHTYAEEGRYQVVITLIDDENSTATTQSVVNVTDAPLVASGNTITATEGTPFTNQIVASFADTDPNGTLTDYSATINWGDGTTAPGTIVPNGSGGYFVEGLYNYDDEGQYAITVTIQDSGGATNTVNTTANVADAALTATGTTLTPIEGNAFAGVVASFTDANPNAVAADFTATIVWGDGHTSSGSIVPNPNGGFDVEGMHTYVDAGHFALSIVINDQGGASAERLSLARVTDAAVSATGNTITATAGKAFSGVVASLTDENPFATAADFSATIQWGDGQISSGVVTDLGAGHFSVSGSHDYSQEGLYDLVIVVETYGGSLARGTGVAGVSPGAILSDQGDGKPIPSEYLSSPPPESDVSQAAQSRGHEGVDSTERTSSQADPHRVSGRRFFLVAVAGMSK
jgi:streptogramin lyase